MLNSFEMLKFNEIQGEIFFIDENVRDNELG
jgi:hypothetical protein